MIDPVRPLAETGHLDRFYIGGAWVTPDGRETGSVVDPSTEAAIAEIPLGSAGDVESAVQAAQRAFRASRRRNGLRSCPASIR